MAKKSRLANWSLIGTISEMKVKIVIKPRKGNILIKFEL
jgi:hypothetical protein